MNKYKENLKKLEEYLESEEGKKHMTDYCNKIAMKEVMEQSQIERFHNKYKDRIDEVFERLITKYDSDKYRNHEYKMGVEPREPLYWFLFKYAQTHGKPCTDDKYINDFTGEIHYLGSYVIQVMHGQGSCIRIDKI